MSKEHTKAPIRSWASERLSEDIRRTLERLARSDDVRRIVVMPDVHLGHHVCVGTVFATSELIYPDAIGGDIGCGMSAVAFDARRPSVTAERAREWYVAIRNAVPIKRQRAAAAEGLADLVPASTDLSLPVLQVIAEAEGATQIGTLGTGNHFLELQYDDDDRLWLMVHSGSRGLGQAIRAAHLKFAQRSRSGLMFLDANTSAGLNYLRDMHWARHFAAASRRVMLEAVAASANDLFGWQLQDETLFDCDHNHINREEHFGKERFIHRKGAMSAWRDVPGIVPGSMAAPSFHVTGRGLADALCSSAHGAGRALSRSAARQRVSRTRLLRELQHVYVDAKSVGGLREEAPSAYKDIHAVMKAQRKLVCIRRTLLPLLTYKGTAQ
jgi:tRNA-splicing ligase RtcB